ESDCVEQAVLGNEARRSRGGLLLFVQRDPREVEGARDLLELHVLLLRDLDDLGHDLEAEATHEAMTDEEAEAVAADRAERGDTAVDGELAPALAAEVLRDLDGADALECAQQRAVLAVERLAARVTDREAAGRGALVQTGLRHRRAQTDDRADDAIGTDDLRDAILAEAVLEADHRAVVGEPG